VPSERRRPAVRRRSLPLLAAALALPVLALPLVAAAPPSAQAAALQPVTEVPDLRFTVAVGPEDQPAGLLPGALSGTAPATTCDVDADLYLPASASAADPVPAILTTNGFGGSKADQAGLGRAFAARGYAVLSYTGLGFPDSGCAVYLDDPLFDGRAASQLVDFLAGGRTAARADGTPYRLHVVATEAPGDPLVGMIGGSYGGQVQFATAAVDDRVDALVPLITWNDLQYSLAPNNTGFTRGVGQSTPGTEKIGWSSLFFGVGITDGLQQSQLTEATGECANFRPEACRAKAQMDLAGYPDAETAAFTRQVSVAHYLDRVQAPVLLVQGQADTLFNLQEAVATYSGLKAQGTPVRMVWQSWGHSGGGQPAPGELDLDGGQIEGTYLGQRIADWFAHWLKGEREAPLGPEFAWFRPWVSYEGNAAPAYGTASRYPVGTQRRLFLSGDGTLVTSARDVGAGGQAWANPGAGAPSSYSETSALQGAVVPDGITPPFDGPGSYGAWTTDPLAVPMDIVGVPRLDVRFDAPVVAAVQAQGPAAQLLVFAKLYDVAPDGSQHLVHRLVSPTRVADVAQPVRIELPGIVHRLEAGHRLRLVLAATDAAYKNAYPVQPVRVSSVPGEAGHVLTVPTTGPMRFTG
jgi:predicted acyl esterase